jgi:hypothetical protein
MGVHHPDTSALVMRMIMKQEATPPMHADELRDRRVHTHQLRVGEPIKRLVKYLNDMGAFISIQVGEGDYAQEHGIGFVVLPQVKALRLHLLHPCSKAA